jgi:hypothetical protein
VRRGKTPVLTEDQARRLLESLDTSHHKLEAFIDE